MARRTPFLARQSYRRRRMIDAARILPFAGLAGYAMPAIWQSGVAPAADTARAGLFLFALWFALIALALALSRTLRDMPGDSEGGGGGGDG